MTERDIRNESDVSDGEFPSDEPLLLGQDGLQHAQDAFRLILVACYSRRDFLRMEETEPKALTVVRTGGASRKLDTHDKEDHMGSRLEKKKMRIHVPLAGHLEEEPLI